MSEPLLTVRGLEAYYGAAPILQGVEFEMGDESLAIVGRNGMGKTTLCASIMGLMPSFKGSARGERTLLIDLLRQLGSDITLLLIEHDMDVALGVAEQVTMMHDGRVIVEGTPDEIRANQLVHDLYLGSGYRNE